MTSQADDTPTLADAINYVKIAHLYRKDTLGTNL